MVMDAQQKSKVEAYIDENEKKKWYWGLADTVADLAWVEKETKEGFINKWLKNDKNLLRYAELAIKTDKLTVWESIEQKLLDIKLSISCPYFVDFKDFLEELKRWSDTSKPEDSLAGASTWTSTEATTETTADSSEISTRTFCWTSVTSIQSEPFQRNGKTWVTRCSKTARFNWHNFGLNLPSWNAYVAGKNPWNDCIQTIPADRKNEQPQKSWEWISASDFKSIPKWNYADIYVESKSNYGHRAAAFKDDSWQWYVLDPYTRVNWKLDNTPKKLEDYLNARKIVKTHIYESKWYGKKSDYEDNWSWYEWRNS